MIEALKHEVEEKNELNKNFGRSSTLSQLMSFTFAKSV